MNLQENHPRLSIAFYGFAERDAGSVSSAGYVILRELLDRGHQIDFFGKRSFAFPVGLDSYPNFRFVDSEGKLERILGNAYTRSQTVARQLIGPLVGTQTRRNIPFQINAEHGKRTYDVCLYFGLWAFRRTMRLPTISWVQGPPGTDARSIVRHRTLLKRLEGVHRYSALRAFAMYRDSVGHPPFAQSDAVICGSKWAAADLRRFVKTNVPIDSLPYPVDLETFTPNGKTTNKPIVLWAGRSVPRKRLDLFLDACSQLLDQQRDFDIQIIGGFSFAPGYRRLINEFKYPKNLHYSAAMPREQMPELYRRATVLVQPSEDENFGSAVAEALACGTCVVVGPSNGTGDYVGEAGFKFQQYETSAVATAIAAALDASSANAAQLWRRSRAIAEQYFDVRSIVAKLENLIYELAAATRMPKGSSFLHIEPPRRGHSDSIDLHDQFHHQICRPSVGIQ